MGRVHKFVEYTEPFTILVAYDGGTAAEGTDWTNPNPHPNPTPSPEMEPGGT